MNECFPHHWMRTRRHIDESGSVPVFCTHCDTRAWMLVETYLELLEDRLAESKERTQPLPEVPKRRISWTEYCRERSSTITNGVPTLYDWVTLNERRTRK